MIGVPFRIQMPTPTVQIWSYRRWGIWKLIWAPKTCVLNSSRVGSQTSSALLPSRQHPDRSLSNNIRFHLKLRLHIDMATIRKVWSTFSDQTIGLSSKDWTEPSVPVRSSGTDRSRPERYFENIFEKNITNLFLEIRPRSGTVRFNVQNQDRRSGPKP